MVDQHNVSARLGYQRADFVGLSRSDKKLWVGTLTGRRNRSQHFGTGRQSEFLELLTVDARRGPADTYVDEDCALASTGSVNQSDTTSSVSPRAHSPSGAVFSSSPAGSLTLRAGTTVEIACL